MHSLGLLVQQKEGYQLLGILTGWTDFTNQKVIVVWHNTDQAEEVALGDLVGVDSRRVRFELVPGDVPQQTDAK